MVDLPIEHRVELIHAAHKRRRVHVQGKRRLVFDEPVQPYLHPTTGEPVGVHAMIRLFDGDEEIPIDPHRIFINPPVHVEDPATELGDESAPVRVDPKRAFLNAIWESVDDIPHPEGWRTKGTVISLYAAAGGYITSTSDEVGLGGTYNQALNGTRYLSLSTPPVAYRSGCAYVLGGEPHHDYYTANEAFLQFDLSSIPFGSVITDTTLQINLSLASSTTDIFEARYYNWGLTLATSDWIPGNVLADFPENYPLLATIQGPLLAGWNSFTSESALLSTVASGLGTLHVVVNGYEFRACVPPLQDDKWRLTNVRSSPTLVSPKLVVTSETPTTPSLTLDQTIDWSVRWVRPDLSIDWDNDGYGDPGTLDDLTGRINLTGGELPFLDLDAGDAPSGTCTRITVERSVTGTLPDEVDITEGTGMATATGELAGAADVDETLSTARYWSIFNTDSPVYGKSRIGRHVRIAVDFLTGTGWQSVPLLTDGVLNGIPVDAAENTATMNVLDGRDKFRRAIILPAFLADSEVTTGGIFGGTLGKPGLEASWVASHALYRAGYYLAPAPRSTCALYIPCHGSMQPFIQRSYAGTAGFTTTVNGTAKVCKFTTGPFFLGTDPDGYLAEAGAKTGPYGWVLLKSTSTAMFASTGRSSGRVEVRLAPTAGLPARPFYITFQPESDYNTDDHYVNIQLNADGTTQLTIVNDAVTRTVAGPTYSFDGQWHLFGCHWTDSTGRVIFSWDQVETLATFTPTTAGSYSRLSEVAAYITTVTKMAELHVDVGIAEAADWLALTYTAMATLDRLQNRRLTGIYPTDPQQVWDILTSLTSAELGLTHIDADGDLQVWSRARLASSDGLTVQRTVTSRDNIVDLAYDDSPRQIRNIIRCKYTTLRTLGSYDFFSTDPIGLWGLDATAKIAPGQTKVWDIEIAAPLAGPAYLNGYVTEGTSSGSSHVTQHTIRYNYCATTALVVSTAITAQAPKGNGETHTVVRCTITNSSDTWLWFESLAGAPSLQLDGATISEATTQTYEVSDTAAIATAGVELPLDLTESPWHQTEGIASGIALGLLALLKDTNQYVITDLRITGDPRLALWDRIAVDDEDATKLDTEVIIDGITTTVDVGIDQSLVVRPAKDLWLIGGTGVGTGLGTTIMGSGD